MPKTLKGVALKANKPSDKNKLLKAIVHANKKSIEEAKAEREQLKLGKGSKKMSFKERSGDHFIELFQEFFLFEDCCI